MREHADYPGRIEPPEQFFEGFFVIPQHILVAIDAHEGLHFAVFEPALQHTVSALSRFALLFRLAPGLVRGDDAQQAAGALDSMLAQAHFF